jgi:hypothetical integral membrane protein (TIGR02206 family)
MDSCIVAGPVRPDSARIGTEAPRLHSNLPLFSPAHLLVLLSVSALALALIGIGRARPASGPRLRFALALLLTLNMATWYGYLAVHGWLTFPGSLPLQLCDATLVLAVAALLTLNPLCIDLAYYGTLAGTTMALLTPDLPGPFPSFSTVQFFISHGLVVASILFLVGAKQARPRTGSVWRAMVGLNLFAVFAAAFNAAFGTNYMYLRSKPESPSLLDYLGPWPWFLLSGEVVALALFALLWFPFRSSRRFDASG